MLLKGPTGCGKTRFVEAMAHQLGRDLITVAGHEDMTSADLVGRFLLKGGETVWVDGPLTRAVREGAIFYLDEVVEARQDTTVVIHPLADHRRELARRPARHDTAGGARISAGDLLQPRLPERAEEPQGVDPSALHRHRARLPIPPRSRPRWLPTKPGSTPRPRVLWSSSRNAIRNLDGSPLREVSSTRMLILAGGLVAEGLNLRSAVQAAIVQVLSDDPDVIRALDELVDAVLPRT